MMEVMHGATIAGVTAAWGLSFATSPAVIFMGTADPTYHASTAPAGAYADSGWQYQGWYGSFLGTAISSKHFITATHVGISNTFTAKAFFTGGGSDVTYTRNTTANGGTGFWLIPGTDLRIVEINETFPTWAPLYSGSDEVGKELVVMGRGTQRGSLLTVGGEAKGWLWGPGDNVTRWGLNEVTQTVAVGAAQYLWASFDAAAGFDESHLSGGDSGGAVFLQEGGVWKLAGINYAVNGPWDLDGIANGNGFNAALFDAGGLYIGSDSQGWNLIPNQAENIPSGFYATRISAYRQQIAAITGIPEPSAALGIGWACVVLAARRRRRD